MHRPLVSKKHHHDRDGTDVVVAVSPDVSACPQKFLLDFRNIKRNGYFGTSARSVVSFL